MKTLKPLLIISIILLYYTVNAQITGLNLAASTKSASIVGLNQATATNSFEVASEFNFNVHFGKKRNFYRARTIPTFSIGFEKRASFIGIGGVFGYTNYGFSDFYGSSIHEPYVGVRVVAHGLEMAELFSGNEWEITKFIDPYLSFTPTIRAAIYTDSYLGDTYVSRYWQGISLGLRAYYKSIGLNLEFGRTAPGRVIALGIVFRRLN